jgi:UDP-2,3-diacylglucosamine hydrolase
MVTYFISDIHLDANSAAQSKLLLNFLATEARQADALYILGDLFAIWLGDDLHEPYSDQLINALQELSAHNVPIYFLRGNRDFLIGDQFCRTAKCQLLPEQLIVNLYGQNVLLTHGDLLCTADKDYQRFRKIVQHPILNKFFLGLPIKWRKKLGMWIKSKSKRAPKNPAVYDVELSTVADWFTLNNVHLMIHGHTHKPAIHNYGTNTRIVLGDWTAKSAQILAFSSAGFELKDLAL